MKAVKTYLKSASSKAKYYGTIASVSLNVMLALGVLGYAYCAGHGYAPLPSFQAAQVDPDMAALNTVREAMKVSSHSIQPAPHHMTYGDLSRDMEKFAPAAQQAVYHQGDVPPRKPVAQ